jgi:hypothetical protein
VRAVTAREFLKTFGVARRSPTEVTPASDQVFTFVLWLLSTPQIQQIGEESAVESDKKDSTLFGGHYKPDR